MSGNPAVDGNPKSLYLLCRNTGYDASNPDPDRENAPDMSPPVVTTIAADDVPDGAEEFIKEVDNFRGETISIPHVRYKKGRKTIEMPVSQGDDAVLLNENFYYSMQVIANIWVADDIDGNADANHRHWMPVPSSTHISQELAGDTHFHNSWIKQDGGQIWSTESLVAEGKPVHDHEVDTMRITNSLGEQGLVQRPKWMFVLAQCNTWTHDHWTQNGGGRTIIVAERPYVSGDNADPSTWQFENKAPNTAWESSYRNQLNNFWRSRFGLELPKDDGGGDKGVENDRRLVSWWSAVNSYQFRDESRFG